MDGEAPARDPERRAVLEAADGLFYQRGIAAVGIDDIRDAAGVSLRRLYRLFPGKPALVSAWLADRHERWMGWLTDEVERRAADGAAPVQAAFDALDAWAQEPGFRGCAFLNAAGQDAGDSPAIGELVTAHKDALRNYLAGLAADAGAADPASAGLALAVLFDGAVVQARLGMGSAAVQAARGLIPAALGVRALSPG